MMVFGKSHVKYLAEENGGYMRINLKQSVLVVVMALGIGTMGGTGVLLA